MMFCNDEGWFKGSEVASRSGESSSSESSQLMSSSDDKSDKYPWQIAFVLSLTISLSVGGNCARDDEGTGSGGSTLGLTVKKLRNWSA